MTVVGAAPKGVVGDLIVAEPGPGDEIGLDVLVGIEIAAQCPEDKDVFLGVRPAAALAVGQESANDLVDQRVFIVDSHQPVEDDAVGAPRGVENSVGAVGIGLLKLGGGGGLLDLAGDPFEHSPLEPGFAGGRKEPAQGFE